MGTQVTVVLLVVFLALSAFFSSAETAFFALQRVRVQHLVESGAPLAKRVQRMKQHPERFLATILLGNSVVNIAISALATSLAIEALGEDRRGLGVAIAIVLGTVVVVVLGEIAPKTLAARFPERIAFLYVRPLEILERVLLPVATVLRAVSSIFTRPFGKGPRRMRTISGDELRTLVAVGAREGAVEPAQAEIIKKAFRFGDLRAQAIMTPRTEIVWVPKQATIADFFQVYAREIHTRFPVYEGEPDNVIGILYIKDLLKALADGRVDAASGIASLLRPAHYYPETKPVDDLFAEMRHRRTQMVLLVDEFGGIAGLLTLKRIAGEIMGHGADEEADVKTIDEETVQVDASMRVEEANERLHLGLPDGDYETLAGFILAQLGRIPREGEQVSYDGLCLVVAEMKGIKIERIMVKRS